MSWATGLILWLAAGMVVGWLWGQLTRRNDRLDQAESDWIAERKRRLEADAYRTRMGVKR